MQQSRKSGSGPQQGNAATPPSTGDAAARQFLDVRKAAQLLGVSERKFHELRAEGLVPEPLRLGARVLRWERHELIDHVRSHAPRGAGPEPQWLADARAVTRGGSGG